MSARFRCVTGTYSTAIDPIDRVLFYICYALSTASKQIFGESFVMTRPEPGAGQSHASHQDKNAGNNMRVTGRMDGGGVEFRGDVDLVGENGADQI